MWFPGKEPQAFAQLRPEDRRTVLSYGLAALAPYAHTMVHAKYWNRWATCDVQRCVRIMEGARFTGVYALEYEDGPWDRVEGAKYLYKEVLAAL